MRNYAFLLPNTRRQKNDIAVPYGLDLFYTLGTPPVSFCSPHRLILLLSAASFSPHFSLNSLPSYLPAGCVFASLPTPSPCGFRIRILGRPALATQVSFCCPGAQDSSRICVVAYIVATLNGRGVWKHLPTSPQPFAG